MKKNKKEKEKERKQKKRNLKKKKIKKERSVTFLVDGCQNNSFNCLDNF